MPFPRAWGSPIDGLSLLFPTWFPGALPNQFVYSGVQFPLGTVAVELSSGDPTSRGNGWIAVTTRGSVGDAGGARVPRDGYGAVLRVTPAHGQTAIRPVLGGSSYASQNARELTFGLGAAHRATVEVLWPGGVRNRLYDVRAGERIVFPEIPCSFDDPGATPAGYAACVVTALGDLVSAGAIHPGEGGRYLGSALRAFAESRHGH
jgi:hypothetical protein